MMMDLPVQRVGVLFPKQPPSLRADGKPTLLVEPEGCAL